MKLFLNLWMAASLMLFTGNSYANDAHKHEKGQSNVAAENVMYSGDVMVHVTGLVCDFCAQALEKVFSKQEAVQSIHVDLNKSLVSVTLKEGHTMSHQKLIQLIVDSGYNVDKVEASDHE